MGAQGQVRRPPRVLLDTNVVLSALLFSAGRVAWLRAAWRDGTIRPLASRETVLELLRVLTYPKFRLTPAEREELLGDYLPWVETVPLPAKTPAVPACRDSRDVVFLVLAKAGWADALVTGDADLLALASSFAVPILTLEMLREKLFGAGA